MIGTGEVDLTALVGSERSQGLEVVAKLVDRKSKAAGEVVLLVKSGVNAGAADGAPTSASLSGTVVASVVAEATTAAVVIGLVRAEHLPSRDTFKQDPYVKLTLVGDADVVLAEGKSTVVKKGGVNPTWPPDAAPIRLPFSAKTGSRLVLRCVVMDKDAGSKDDEIGFGDVDVAHLASAAAVTAQGPPKTVLVRLRDAKKPAKSGGLLVLTAESKPPTEQEALDLRASRNTADAADASAARRRRGVDVATPPQQPAAAHGTLWVEVLRGHRLKDQDTFGKQDPYVVVWVDTPRPLLTVPRGRWKTNSPPPNTSATAAAVDGGAEPTWTANHHNVCPVRLDGSVVPPASCVVYVEVWDEDTGGSDDFIGVAVLPNMPDVVKANGAPLDMTLDLTGNEGDTAGQLTVTTWFEPDAPSNAASGLSRAGDLLITVRKGLNLPKPLLGDSAPFVRVRLHPGPTEHACPSTAVAKGVSPCARPSALLCWTIPSPHRRWRRDPRVCADAGSAPMWNTELVVPMWRDVADPTPFLDPDALPPNLEVTLMERSRVLRNSKVASGQVSVADVVAAAPEAPAFDKLVPLGKSGAAHGPNIQLSAKFQPRTSPLCRTRVLHSIFRVPFTCLCPARSCRRP